MKRITLKDIAKEANVSVMTVSNVINNKCDKVSKEKEKEILAIIKKNNYTPNMNARAMLNLKSKLIGVLYFSKSGLDFSNPFIAEILSGIEKKAKENGYFILVNHFESADELITIQNNWRFAGFVIIGLETSEFERYNHQMNGPVVYLDTNVEINKGDFTDKYFVNTTDRELGKIATQHQIDLNHKKIGFFGYQFHENVSCVIRERYLGYLEIMKNQQNSFGKLIQYNVGDDIRDYYDKFSDLTAVVVSADILAAELMLMLKEKGEQLSIIGFDDMYLSKFLTPSLSTIKIDQRGKGKLAIETLIKSIKRNENINQITTVGGTLISRESSYVCEND